MAADTMTPLNEGDAAKHIGMSPSYLRLSRVRGSTKCTDAPAFMKIGKAIRYCREILMAGLRAAAGSRSGRLMDLKRNAARRRTGLRRFFFFFFFF